jgi:hypothetical protein
MDIVNSPDCPPSVAWTMTRTSGRVTQLRLFQSDPVEGSRPHIDLKAEP